MKLKLLVRLFHPQLLCLTSLFLMSSELCSLHCFVTAWGKEGHEMVADIAWGRLSNATKEVITKILFPTSSKTNDPDDPDDSHKYGYDTSKYASPMSAVATWADSVRYSKGAGLAWTEPMHFVDVRDDLIPGGCHYSPPSDDTGSNHCSFVYDRDCSNGLCVVHAIQQFTDNLFKPSDNNNYDDRDDHDDHDDYDNKNHQDTTSLRGSTTTKERITTFGGPPPPPEPYKKFTTRQSLMFLIHFIGDIHQPLHISRKTDIGGNTIHVSFPKPYHFQYSHLRSPTISTIDTIETIDMRVEKTKKYPQITLITNHHHKDSSHPKDSSHHKNTSHHKGWNLHSVWDSGMIEYIMDEKFSKSQSKYQSYIEMTYLANNHDSYIDKWTQCTDTTTHTCISNWAEESWDDAIEYAYDDEQGHEIQNGDDLTTDYIESRIVIVEKRIAAAGVRLASALEMIYNSKQTGVELQAENDEEWINSS